MKSNKKIFEENNKDIRDKVSNMNYNSKTTMQSNKKGFPVAEKNANLAKNELKESDYKGDKNTNLNVNKCLKKIKLKNKNKNKNFI
jgi:glutamate/tyrosine decarboxylase-like PLP-dependent enzyme